MRGKVIRNVLLLLSIGLAVHLILPQIPGIEKSLKLAAETSHALVLTAFVAELSSELSYAGLLRHMVGLTSGPATSSRSRRKTGLWFMLRLTICGYGAAHVLPGGGAAAATVTYSALRSRGFDSRKVALALAVISVLIYAVLGLLFAGSLVYLYANGDLGPVAKFGVIVAFILTLGALAGSYAAYRRPLFASRALARVLRLGERLLGSRWSRQNTENLSGRLVSGLRERFRNTRRQMSSHPLEAVKLVALAFGYWGFDVLCLILMLHAFGVPAGTVELLVAYGVATVAGSLPLTPGGIGVFETSMIATLALLGVGSEAAIPVLGYRLFNFWLPIPLALVFYPTLHRRV